MKKLIKFLVVAIAAFFFCISINLSLKGNDGSLKLSTKVQDVSATWACGYIGTHDWCYCDAGGYNCSSYAVCRPEGYICNWE